MMMSADDEIAAAAGGESDPLVGGGGDDGRRPESPTDADVMQDVLEEEEDGAEVYAKAAAGTILEAAFVDPAYAWPPVDGQGKNAIELQASVNLINSSKRGGSNNNIDDSDARSVATTESWKERMKLPKKPRRPNGGSSKVAWWRCCRNNDAVADGSNNKSPQRQSREWKEYEAKKLEALKARKEYAEMKRGRAKKNAKAYRDANKYNLTPEGILVYRLDTSTHMIRLMSAPHSNTNLKTLMTEMKVLRANPSPDKSRRGMELVGEDGTMITLVACEQRTATAWLEAMNLMKAKQDPSGQTTARDVR